MKASIAKIASGLMFAAAVGFSVRSDAGQADRTIYVNGDRMSAVEIIALDILNCGEAVPNGRYWVNWTSQAWGYEGRRQQGWLPNCAEQASAGQAERGGSKGTWEDRTFEGLCVENGRCDVEIIHFPQYN